MRFSRLYGKVFLVCVGGNAALALSFLTLLTWGLEPFVVARVQERLHDTAIVLRGLAVDRLDAGQRDSLQRLVREMSSRTKTRFTVLDAEGDVLADSHEDPRRMENHAARPEVRGAAAAKIDGMGIDRRSSATVGLPMIYLALRVERDRQLVGYVRVAAEIQTVREQVTSLRRWGLLIGGTALLATTGCTFLIVRRIVRPLERLAEGVAKFADDGTPRLVRVEGRDEVAVLGNTFNRMQESLAARWGELRRNNDRLEGMMRSMEEGVLALDAEERIVLANDASRMLLELGEGNVAGRRLWEATRVRALRDAFLETFPSGHASVKEFETTGVVRRVLTLRATRLPGEPSPGVMMVLHDVSELRRLENLRRDFVANVSHELKTPLSSIKAYAETLRLGALEDTTHNRVFVERIEEQADRLHQLIMDLLHLARVESGQQAFEITRVSMRGMVESILKAHAATASSRQIELASEPPERVIAVRADEEGLRTILNNLVDNAIKYTPVGGRVTVRWRSDGAFATLEVQDTGIGIARQHHARVFERFYRVDKARSRELGGTGLGLAIVKHLAQAFGGSVGIESQVRQGSTFRVTLPLDEADSAETEEADEFSVS
ncbi:MAG: ATP-binding protein [Pirellulales bacterium]